MPRMNPHPLFALLGEFDGRPWRGSSPTDLFNRGGVATALPTSTPYTTEGIYDDLLDLLNGRGSTSTRTLPALCASQWTGAGTFTATFTSDDRINFQSTVETFDIGGNAGAEFLGIPATGTGVIAAGAPGYTTPNEWTRGNFDNLGLSVFPGVGIPFLLLPDAFRYQDVPVLFRDRGVIADADDAHPLDNIQKLDNDINDPAGRSIQWGISDAGFVWSTWPNAIALALPTWLSTTFRDALGFDGSETVVTLNGQDSLTANNRPPTGLFPSRPLVRQFRVTEEEGAADRLTSGAWSSNVVGSYGGWQLDFHLDGPAGPRDQHRHYMDEFLHQVTHGRRVTLYQDWGDSRRAAPLPNLGDYGLLYTVEGGGYRGRLRLRIHPRTGDRYDARWPGELRRRRPTSLIFTDDERGQ